MFELRDYQQELINGVYQSILNGNRTIVVQSPPRTGKTVVMAEIARRATVKHNQVMFVVHRKEIIDQVKATFVANGVDMTLCQIGMVQTFSRRLDKLNSPAVILIDEAHHALAKSYLKIMEQFPNAYKLLFTATPRRLGKKQLDQVATDIVLGKTIQWLTVHGRLAPFDYYSIDDIDHDKLKRSSTGDYTNDSMSEAMGQKIYGSIVNEYKRLANGKQAVVYTHSIESAQKVAEQFKQAGITAEEVNGDTPTMVRDEIVSRFRDQKLSILVNVNLFTEGIDLPNVDCVIMARPTESLSLYLQFAMRCLNPRDGKRAVIIDHVANWKKHGLPTTEHDWRQAMITETSSKRSSSNNDVGMTIVQCEKCFGVFDRAKVKDNICPACGANPMVKRMNGLQTDDQAKLRLIKEEEFKKKRRQKLIKQMMEDAVMNSVADKSLSELVTYEEFAAYAKLHNYSLKWAYYQIKRRKHR